MGKVFRRLQDSRTGHAGQPVGVHTLLLNAVAYLVELHAFLEKTVPAEHREAWEPVMTEMRTLESAYRNFMGARRR